MDYTFNKCVELLIWGANLLGITYNEINVWLFVIIHPSITLILLFLVFYYKRKLNRYKSEVSTG